MVDYAAGDFSRSMHGSEAVARGSPPCVDRHWKIVARLNDLMRELPTAPLYTSDLASRIGTSPRTLQTAVQAVYGVSLHRYVRLMRLWSAHCQLQRGCPSVKAAALANGFWHMGDFSRFYKSTFGETPSVTLERTRRAQSAWATLTCRNVLLESDAGSVIPLPDNTAG
jgi:transcriptional regulator GlxA family with amidase domain